jgi:hypothetical protein
MSSTIKKIPWFYILFAFYPLLFLWSANVAEIYSSEVLRPFLITLVVSGILFGILYLVFRNVHKAGLAGTLLLLAFFSYGHVYYEARSVPALHLISHHTVLIPVYTVIFGLAIWWIVFRVKNYSNLIRSFNILGLLLVGISVVRLLFFQLNISNAAHQNESVQSELHVSSPRNSLPDVYYIILDGYTRADALKQSMGFDNSDFITTLTDMGFYVAPCSRPNYDFTRGSLASSLNMNYIPNMPDVSTAVDSSFYAILKNNEVRRQFESIGYKIVAFQTDYPWLNWENADVYLGSSHATINFQNIYPFEAMYWNTTGTVAVDALMFKLGLDQYIVTRPTQSLQITNPDVVTGVLPLDQVYLQNHINTQLFILNNLPQAAGIAGPKFVYAHIMIPHYPHVFSPDGSILTDPGYYGNGGKAVDENYNRQGYLDAVQFINSRIVPILQTILAQSTNPPIIIVQGDHGQSGRDRYTNLNAYYLPDGYDDLYSSITPVNSFRIIFNDYFGASYPLLPDVSHASDTIVEDETYPDCLP